MKYTNTIYINRPLERVVQPFGNADNMSKWMKGLVSFEHLGGTAGHPGAKSRLKFRMGKRDMEKIETVTVRNLPHEFSGIYETQGVFNVVLNFFEKTDENTTRYATESKFQFKGFMKVIAFLHARCVLETGA